MAEATPIIHINPAGFSIAVLPFVNMSNDSEQGYFSDGITEEIINVLAQVPALKVAGRTSCFTFKNKNQDLRNSGYYVKSLVLLEKFQFYELILTIEKATLLYPSCLTMCFKGIAYVFSGQIDKAKEVVAELEDNPEKYPISHHDMGQFYIALGDLDKARYHWQKALEQQDGRMLFIHTFFRKAKFFKTHPRFQHFFKAIEAVLRVE